MDIKVLASGSTGNCYLISDGHTDILIECGLPVKQIQEGLAYRLSAVDGCLISHEHKDHSRAALELLYKCCLDIYTSKGTAEALGLSTHRRHIVTAKEQFEIGTLTVLPFETQHDAAEPLGFFIQSEAGARLLYATDTYYLRYRFPWPTHIMIECNYIRDILEVNVNAGIVPLALRDRLLESHFSLENVKKFLEANDLSQVKGIWLLHMSDQNCDAGRAKREIQELTGIPTYIAQEVATCQ